MKKELTVKDSIKKLYSARENQDIVDKFAREAYNEKFPDANEFQKGSYHGYKGFDIIDEHTIRVNYVFGSIHGDFDYNESFIIDVK